MHTTINGVAHRATPTQPQYSLMTKSSITAHRKRVVFEIFYVLPYTFVFHLKDTYNIVLSFHKSTTTPDGGDIEMKG